MKSGDSHLYSKMDQKETQVTVTYRSKRSQHVPTPSTSTSKQRLQILLAQVLFFLNAAVWILFLILFISDQATPGDAVSSWVVPILMGGNALAMLVCGIGLCETRLGKHSRFFYYLSLAVLGVNIILTVTDQVGLFDYITLLLDLVILILLVASYSAFKRPSKSVDLSHPTV